MIADKVLPLLVNVKQTGQGKWIASCPVHHDTHPSFSIMEATSKSGEPTLLMRCFACHAPIDEICAALGLQVSDLYPTKKETDNTRKYFPAADVLRCLSNDVFMAKVFARKLHEGGDLTVKEKRMIHAIEQRLGDACEYIG